MVGLVGVKFSGLGNNMQGMSPLVTTGDVLFISESRFIKALLQVTSEDIVLFGVHGEGVAPNHREHRTSCP